MAKYILAEAQDVAAALEASEKKWPSSGSLPIFVLRLSGIDTFKF